MFKKILKSKAFGNTAIYALANLLNGAIPFLLLPILTRVFSPEEYGLVTLISAIITLLGVFTGLSVHGAVSIKFFDKSIVHSKYVGACLQILLFSTILIMATLFIFRDYTNQHFNIPIHWFLIATVTSAMQFVINIKLTIWQVQEKAFYYATFQIFQTLLNFSISLCFIFILSLGWQGRVGGIVLSTFLCASLAIYLLSKSKEFTLDLDMDYVKQALMFGIPLIPHIMGGMAISIANRPIISNLAGNDQLGKFYVGLQVAMAIPMISQALLNAFLPTLYRSLSANLVDLKRKIVISIYCLFLFLAVISISYYLILPIIFHIFIGRNFIDTLGLSEIMIFGFLFEGMYLIIAGIFYHEKKTGLLSIITFTVGIFGLVLTYLFTKDYGIRGSAYAFVVTQVVYFLTCWFWASRIYSLPWFSFLEPSKKSTIEM